MLPIEFLVSIALFIVTATTDDVLNRTCGGILNGSGYLYTPNYPANYSGNTKCRWTLLANPQGANIILYFRSIDTEEGYDVVTVYDENNNTDTFSGTPPPYSLSAMILGASANVIFSSDSFFERRGFEATFYSEVSNHFCGSILNGAGSISTPNYPGNYSGNTNCRWTLLANSQGANVRLQFLSLETEYRFDFVTVYDEKNNEYKFSGSHLPFAMTLGSSANVMFTSDSYFEKTGFYATFDSVLANNFSLCTGIDVYWCDISKKCISSKWWCDNRIDCIYGEDEDRCPLTSTTSTTWATSTTWTANTRMSEAATTGVVIGSAIGFFAFLVIIVSSCRAVSARRTRTTAAARAVQQQNATVPMEVWSVPEAYPRQYKGVPTSQANFETPPPYDAAAKAYTAGWQVSDQLPASDMYVSNSQSPSQVLEPSA